jgi:ATP-dependent protease ClpP protease subunit
MAAVITASGAHRSSQPQAILRFHDVQLDGDDQLRGLEEQYLLDVLAQHTGKTKEAWADVFHEGRFISPRLALELGALDEIQGTSLANAAHPAANPGRLNRKEHAKQYRGDRFEGRNDR